MILFPLLFRAKAKLFFLLAAIFSLGSSYAIPVTAQLALTENDSSVNRMQITIDAVASDTDTAILTGGVVADFDVSPDGTVTALTLREGRVDASTVNFQGRVFFVTVYDVTASNLSAAVETPVAPGLVQAGGSFDASQYSFIIDQGVVQGTSAGGNVDLTVTPDAPFEGRGSGMGSVVLTPVGSDAIYQDYRVQVSFPIDIDSAFDAGGTPATIRATGTLQAVGVVRVPKSEYLAWTVAEGIPGEPLDDDHNKDGVPNGLAWALGLKGRDNGRGKLPKVLSSREFEWQLPEPGLSGRVRLQVSSDLINWTDVPTARIQGGINPLPKGSKGLLKVISSGLNGEFIRVKIEP